MASQKISELTSYAVPLVADLIPIVDTATATTKQVSFSNLENTIRAKTLVIVGGFI